MATPHVAGATALLWEAAPHMRGVPGIPSESATGVGGRPHDFAQGYGHIDMRTAVGLALTLEAMRTEDADNDGFPDNPNAMVFDAYEKYYGLISEKYVSEKTNVLKADWTGDRAHFEKQSGDPSLGTYSTNTTRFVCIPKETTEIQLTLSYAEYNTERAQVVDLYLTRLLDDGETFLPCPRNH